MPRCTRKQLLVEDEDQARRDREEGYRRLGIELRRVWREACMSGVYRDSQLSITTVL
ncbi:hypothetical protein [Kibdelosporangium philippinense]|uniref:hypothetical protein n=1 Tax=Kibdelosporangium philippinense TaxID=211113 RepID=UPI003606050E